MRCLLVACLAALPLVASAATVTPLEGPATTPPTLVFAGDRVRAGSATLPLVDLDWIELDQPALVPVAEPPQGRPGIWFTDGSWIPFTALASGDGDRIRATTPLGVHDLPLTAIAGWGVNETARAGDAGLDRVVVASGPVDGRVRGLRDGSLLIETALDPEPLALDLHDVQGLRLAQPAVPPTGLTLLTTLDPSRPPTRLRVQGETLVLATSGQPVASDALTGRRLRIDGGRRTWLSDLTPSAVEEQGAFGVVWPWKRDSDLDGGPLNLGGVRQVKGIAVHSAARLRWDLGRRFVRFRALIGISDLVAPEGDCQATLRGDGKELWRRDRVRGGETPVPLDLDLSGVQALELEVGLGERFDIGDHLVLADAYLVGKR